ncbi:MAG: DUF4112 domain-containing protein [Hyphomicrobiaceae bacterium]
MNSMGTPQRYLDPDIAASVARIEMLSKLMDSAFQIPGTNTRMGLDAIIGLIPVVGDVISQAVSSYIIWEARKLGVSRLTIARMIGNSMIDTVVGAIPFAGDAFDVVFRANTKNLALLRSHLAKHGHVMRTSASGPIIESRAVRD